jgi:L-fuculose-phosphate aldolase
MPTVQEQIALVGLRMFERHLTDMSGGNISVRQGDRMFITPRYSGSRNHWHIDPEMIISGSIAEGDLLEHPAFSREGKAHLEIYRTFPDATSVIHAHPFYVLPFCVAEQPIVPPLESAQKFETVEVVPYAPAHSQELADNIVACLRGKEHIIQKQAAVVLLPRHGVIAAGKDLFATVDAVERINWNAWCILAQRLMP